MHRPMSTRERILLTFTVCLTLLALGPLTALAATGQLMNIIDPVTASRAARVTEVGALQVQTRPGIPSGSFNGRGFRTTTGWLGVYELPTGQRAAIVEVTLSLPRTAAGEVNVNFGYTMVASTASCMGTSTGIMTGTFSRAMHVRPGELHQLDFSGVPLLIPQAASGKKHCIGFLVGSTSSFSINLGISGYGYLP